ncbi:Protein of unknown function (DUF2982) [Rheinheimera sp. A13L]|uniref:DUF2982 domain-containing protein n=1 Tax=Rheinheimera sp. A13L TaxID=506534 RepID=UPI00021250E6|nr:DUF2982 domain-containing protein [Rheinheimera sp. A13L]EGM78459.1 Protein of unknown function (DUF2982) [Rheinheimera sp. A13L]
MDKLQYRAATARGGVKTLLLSSTALLLWLLLLLLIPGVLHSTAWVLLLICCLLGLFTGYAKLTEPLYVIELDQQGFAYVHHKGRWFIPWQGFSFISIPEVAGEELAYIGVKLRDYDEFLLQLQPRLAVNLMVEQRHLLVAALGRNCPTGTCPSDLLIEVGEFRTATRSYKGAIAMFARRMQLLRQLTGFDLFIPISSIGTEPADFCRKVNQIRLQCLNNTVT